MNKSISKHTKWMGEALEIGKLALNLKEVPVGCILLNEDDVIIGKGFLIFLLIFRAFMLFQ